MSDERTAANRARPAAAILPPSNRRLDHLLREAHRLFDGESREILAALLLSPSECTVLGALHDREETPIQSLRQEIGIGPTNLATITTNFAHRGLVRRTHDADDGRLVLIALTSQGRKVAAQAMRILDYQTSKVRERFGSSDYERLIDLLDQCASKLGRGGTPPLL